MNIRSYRGTYGVSFTSMSELIEKVSHIENAYTIIDKNIYNMYKKDLNCLLEDNYYVLEATETNKTLDVAKTIIDKIVLLDSRKETKIVAIGGGITQDLSCFVSSIIYRGVKWYLIPTTLLAQTDSCIGSKSSINMTPYKNLLGTFYPPTEIFLCTDFLRSLPEKEYYSGLGEIIKCSLLSGQERFTEFANNLGRVLNRDYDRLKEEINKTLIYKRELIEADEFDMGIRNILNYGHTFGHAIESASEYKVPHGQAVSIGILIANNVSLGRGLISKEYNDSIAESVRRILSADLISDETFDLSKIISNMKKDKKYNKHHNCILLGPAGADKYPVSETEISDSLLRTRDVLCNLTQ